MAATEATTDRPSYNASQIAMLLGVCRQTLIRDLNAGYSVLLDYFLTRRRNEELPQLVALKSKRAA